MQLKDIYTDFSSVYDYVLRHVDYDRWYNYIKTVMLKYVGEPDSILEIGCGTGRFGAKFSRDNYTIYGVDRSLAMLRVARMRARRNFRVFCGDMRALYLAKKFDFIFSVHDTMNYILTYRDLARVFRSVRGIMHRKSIFFFDITTEYNIRRYFENRTSYERFRDVSIKWENRYDSMKRRVHSILHFTKADGVVSVEEHVQRIYSIQEISRQLERARLEIMDIFSDYSFLPVRRDTVMVNFVVKMRE